VEKPRGNIQFPIPIWKQSITQPAVSFGLTGNNRGFGDPSFWVGLKAAKNIAEDLCRPGPLTSIKLQSKQNSAGEDKRRLLKSSYGYPKASSIILKIISAASERTA